MIYVVASRMSQIMPIHLMLRSMNFSHANSKKKSKGKCKRKWNRCYELSITYSTRPSGLKRRPIETSWYPQKAWKFQNKRVKFSIQSEPRRWPKVVFQIRIKRSSRLISYRCLISTKILIHLRIQWSICSN